MATEEEDEQMNLQSVQEQVKSLITQTLTSVCHHGLAYNSDLLIEGSIRITLDKSTVYEVDLNEETRKEQEHVVKTEEQETQVARVKKAGQKDQDGVAMEVVALEVSVETAEDGSQTALIKKAALDKDSQGLPISRNLESISNSQTVYTLSGQGEDQTLTTALSQAGIEPGDLTQEQEDMDAETVEAIGVQEDETMRTIMDAGNGTLITADSEGNLIPATGLQVDDKGMMHTVLAAQDGTGTITELGSNATIMQSDGTLVKCSVPAIIQTMNTSMASSSHLPIISPDAVTVGIPVPAIIRTPSAGPQQRHRLQTTPMGGGIPTVSISQPATVNGVSISQVKAIENIEYQQPQETGDPEEMPQADLDSAHLNSETGEFVIQPDMKQMVETEVQTDLTQFDVTSLFDASKLGEIPDEECELIEMALKKRNESTKQTPAQPEVIYVETREAPGQMPELSPPHVKEYDTPVMEPLESVKRKKGRPRKSAVPATPSEVYDCTLCDRTYQRPQDLKRHMVTHGVTPNKPSNKKIKSEDEEGSESMVEDVKHEPQEDTPILSSGRGARVKRRPKYLEMDFVTSLPVNAGAEGLEPITTVTYNEAGQVEVVNVTTNIDIPDDCKPQETIQLGETTNQESSEIIQAHLQSIEGMDAEQIEAAAKNGTIQIAIYAEGEDGQYYQTEEGQLHNISMKVDEQSQINYTVVSEQDNLEQEIPEATPETPAPLTYDQFEPGWFYCDARGCGYKNTNYNDVHVHLYSTHGGKGNYRCDICDRDYRNTGNYRSHMGLHIEGAKPFSCQYCGLGFIRKAHCQSHEKTHERKALKAAEAGAPQPIVKMDIRPGVYFCPICFKETKKFDVAWDHMVDYHIGNEEPGKCDICRRGYKGRSLKMHMQTHIAGDKPYKCQVCGKGFLRPRDVERHAVKHTRKVKIRRDTSGAVHICEQCGKRFFTAKKLKDHMDNHNRRYQCEICSLEFKFHSKYLLHMRTHTGEKPFICELCGKQFATKFGLGLHTHTHTGAKPHKCTVCQKSFVGQGNLRRHMQQHIRDKLYQCETCGRTFTDKYYMKKHMIRHAGYRPHVCENCGKTFVSPAELRNHERIHTGERPWKCEICGKTFSWNAIYRSHMKRHINDTNEKRPHHCDVCGKGFHVMYELRRHRFTHTEDRPFKCGVCGKGFVEAFYAKLHLMSHTGQWRHRCGICGKGFIHATTFKRHRCFP